MVFGPAKRKYIKSSSHPVKIGETWSIDSGLGGSFTVEYQGGDSWKIVTRVLRVRLKSNVKIGRSVYLSLFQHRGEK